MSSDDIAAELGHAAAPLGATGLPLVGLTLGTDGAWSGRFWIKTGSRKYEFKWCETVRVVGEHFKITYNNTLLPVPKFKPELERTVSAWGEEAQAKLARLRFGIVGAGSVGSIVAESLARTGIQHVKLIDFDSIETVNLDRLVNVNRRDVGLSKAVAIARVIPKSATASGFVVEPLEYSIVEEEGFRHALDCDILFSCVDRPWPRSVLNFIAYAHLIPVVDGGIKVRRSSRGTSGRQTGAPT